MIVLDLFSSTLKLLVKSTIGFNNITLRPYGNKNCSILPKDYDINTPRIGMPSGHSIFSGFLMIWCIENYNKDKLSKYILPISIIIPFSRLNKERVGFLARCDSGCHNIPQIVVGFIFGMVVAYHYL